jgi:hypothetical protein
MDSAAERFFGRAMPEKNPTATTSKHRAKTSKQANATSYSTKK